MELSQLRYFKTVAELEHFTQAAEVLHISQPSLSKSISNLETELGVELFERTKRNVYLNVYGRVLLRYVNKIFIELDEAKAEISDLSSGASGDIYIASSAIFSEPSPISKYISQFFLEHPYIGLHSYIEKDTLIQSMLRDRKIDFGLAMRPAEEVEIESVRLLSFRLGVVVGRDHPLANQKEVSLWQLRDDYFMCNNTSVELADSIYEFCHKAGFHPKVIFEGESSALIGKAVSQGIGVAFVSEERHAWQHERYPWEQDIRFLRVTDSFCIRNVYLYYLRDRYLSAAARQFRDGLLELIRPEDGSEA